mmetsp:Transcript_88209/g.246809  ORF Transcript_88209/g.246809 Transcript_88209/m.246809 type:complete len:317 (-) Transcript_88209:327-1277(-)
MLDLKAVVLQLVAPDDQLQTVRQEELARHVLAKGDAHAALGGAAAADGCRIAPEHLRHEALRRRLATAVHFAERRQRHAVLGKKPPVHHEDLAVEDVAEGQEIKGNAEKGVERGVVLRDHLRHEPVVLVQASRLVIATCKEHTPGVQQFPSEQAQHDLDRERTSVHKVAIEDVRVFLGRNPVQLKDVQEIVKLTVDVAADRDLAPFRHLDVDDGLFLLEQCRNVEDHLASGGEGYLVASALPLHQGLAVLRGDAAAPVLRPAALRAARGGELGRARVASLLLQLSLTLHDRYLQLPLLELLPDVRQLRASVHVLWR